MFSHLHVHSHFSLLESSIKIGALVSRAVELGFGCLALTDKYAMHGALQFYKLAKTAGIKPLIGAELCLLKNNIFSHLTILIKNKTGYQNLCRLIKKSYFNRTTGFGIPFIQMDDLEKFSDGLVCLSGCSRGMIALLLKNKDFENAKRFSGNLKEIFGSDFYIEIQRYRFFGYDRSEAAFACFNNQIQHGPSANYISEVIKNFADEIKIPLVATNNVHYLSSGDYKMYACLAKLKLMGTKPDPTFEIIRNNEHYLKSAREMAGLFYDIPQAIKNTAKIAEECCFDFELGKLNLPVFKTESHQSQDEYLKSLCLRGLRFRFGTKPDVKITDRLFKELEVIKKTGFAGYFLIVADIAKFAFENNIPICGKGSAAGSLVSYILGISNVDPVENNLYFERFLNEERKQPPDIDIDVSSRDRTLIWHYLQSRYGNESIARVVSFSTTKPRAALREAGRIAGAPKDEMDHIIKTFMKNRHILPHKNCGRGLLSPGGSSSFAQSPDKSNPQYRQIFCMANGISGYTRHLSTHPSAFIVSDCDLSEKIPLALSDAGELTSQFDMNSIDDIGILKIDLINSLSLDLISDVLSLIKNKRGISIDMAGMACNDPGVFKLMQAGKTLGVFQLESFGIRTLARKIKPASLNDITLLISLYRPGPQQSGMVENFIERKFGREKTSCIHRDLEPILRETYGVMLYQEQAMQVAIKIAGYSLSEADELRKAMANLSKEKMIAQQNRFVRGGILNGYSPEVVNEVFRLISKFASYAFVKAHAAAYAEISYKTCYLKKHFPAEFISTILTNNSGYYSKMQYIEEARRLGIKILLPCVNKSCLNFEVEGNGTSIRIPLTSVKNLGLSAAQMIIDEREKNGQFSSFTDFYNRIKTSSGRGMGTNIIANLIKVGTFDFSGISRKKILLIFHSLKNTKTSPRTIQGSNTLCFAFKHTDSNDAGDTLNGIKPELRLITDKGKTGYFLTDFSLEEKLEIEMEMLGFYVSANPLKNFKENFAGSGFLPSCIKESSSFYDYFKNPKIQNTFLNNEIHDSPIDNGKESASFTCTKDIITAGIIIAKRTEKTKDGKEMMFCTMEDDGGMYEAVLFPDSYKRNLKTITGNSFILLKGRLCLKDNNVSLIVRDIYSINYLKKMMSLKQKERARTAILVN